MQKHILLLVSILSLQTISINAMHRDLSAPYATHLDGLYARDKRMHTYSEDASYAFLELMQVASEQDIINAFDVTVDPNTQEDDIGNYLLHIATSRQMPRVAQILIEAGAKAQLANDLGQTPVDIILPKVSSSATMPNTAKDTLKVLLTAVSPQEKIQFILMPLLTERILAARNLAAGFPDKEIQQAVIESFQSVPQFSDNQDIMWINGLMVSRKALKR